MPIPDFSIIQRTTLIVSLLSLLMLIPLCKIRPHWKGIFLPAFLWALHNALFYIVQGFTFYTEQFPPWYSWLNYGQWASVIRLQGALSIMSISFLMLTETFNLRRRRT